MQVLVDTCVWSLAFRKRQKTESELVLIEYVSDLLRDMKVAMIGPIRQEILSGISDERKFLEMKERLQVLPDWRIETEDYESAALYYNRCRRNGVQGSHIDFLLCAVSVNNHFSILTLDTDFLQYQKYIGIQLAGKKSG